MDNNQRKEPNIFSKICSIVIILLIIVGLIFTVVRCAALTSHASAIDNSNNPLLLSKINVTKSVLTARKSATINAPLSGTYAPYASGDYLLGNSTSASYIHKKIENAFIASTNFTAKPANGQSNGNSEMYTSINWNYDWSHIDTSLLNTSYGGWTSGLADTIVRAWQGTAIEMTYERPIVIDNNMYIQMYLELPLSRQTPASSVYVDTYVYYGDNLVYDGGTKTSKLTTSYGKTDYINISIPSNLPFDRIVIVPVYEVYQNPANYISVPYATEVKGWINYYTHGTITAVGGEQGNEYMRGYEDGKVDGFLRAYYQLLSSNETEMDEDVKVIYNYLKNKFESGSGNDGSYQEGYSEGFENGKDYGINLGKIIGEEQYHYVLYSWFVNGDNEAVYNSMPQKIKELYDLVSNKQNQIGYEEGYSNGTNNIKNSFNEWLANIVDFEQEPEFSEKMKEIPEWINGENWDKLVKIYQEISYSSGYINGVKVTEDKYKEILENAGKNNNWSKGYSEGYDAAKATYSNGGGGDVNAFTNGFAKIISTLGDSIFQFLNIEIYGITLHSILAGLAVMFILAFVIKMVIKGGE